MLSATSPAPTAVRASQAEIEAKGQQIFARIASDKHLPDALNPAHWMAKVMEWTMGNEALKTQTLRFVDVLPSLRENPSVVGHLDEYFGGRGSGLAGPLRWGLGLSRFAPGLAGLAVRMGVGGMARQFITGRDGREAVPALRKLRRWGIGFTVDILGEAVVSEREAGEYAARYLELIESLAAEARAWKHSPQLEGAPQHSPNGHRIPKVNVSVKLSALYSQIVPTDPETAIVKLKDRLRPLWRRAKELGVFINLDMEHTALKQLTLDLFKSLLSEDEFAGWPDAGLVIQAYLQDSAADFDKMLSWAKERDQRITVRLVKGAYWDYETVVAKQRDWPIPVYLKKPQADANFERISRRMLDNNEHVYAAFGTHNVRSMAHAIAYAEKLGLTRRDYEIQMLYGMAPDIKDALVGLGHRVREYCPVGELLPGIAYFVRRLLENTSNEGFLKAKFSAASPGVELLRDPMAILGTNGLDASPNSFDGNAPHAHAFVNGHRGRDERPHSSPESRLPAMANLDALRGLQSGIERGRSSLPRDFENAPPTDFTLEANRQKMRDALAAERVAFGRDWPLVIGGERVTTGEWIDSINPSRPSEIVGRAARATVEHAARAVETASNAARSWAQVPADTRATMLDRLADLMDAERFSLAALEVYEVGKPWAEADGDVVEAIDFCRFYAVEMRRLGRPRRTEPMVPGEVSEEEYLPRGVGLVIAPWNFPLAILCGMTVAAMVTGNAVIMKPAEQSGVIAARLMELAERAGFPAGVLNLVSGHGEDVGAFLVEHPKVDFIAFTGSKEVGLKIWEAGGRTRPGQVQLKRVVCEMGGKNALIVDADADLDEAVLGASYSAFGFQGQKCSALSRLIVLEENYDRFVERLVEAASCLRVGPPEEPGTQVGPVIDREAFERIRRYIEIGRGEATLAFQGEMPANAGDGYFIPPTIFTNVRPDARIAREEIFGPVLAVLRAKDLNEALRIANGTEFALTGGCYSRSPANLARVRRELRVGNLYLNRTITGAIVGRHPFGGFAMSGGGTKAGGRDYLLNFLNPRVVTENVLRRGFAPVEDGEAEPQMEGAATSGARGI